MVSPYKYQMTAELVRCLELCAEFDRRARELQSAHLESPGSHPKERTALWRTGMELTRALAELRRGRPIEWHLSRGDDQ